MSGSRKRRKSDPYFVEIDRCLKKKGAILLLVGEGSDLDQQDLPYAFNTKDKILEVNILKMTGEERLLLQEKIREQLASNFLILKKTTQDEVAEIKKYTEKNTDKKLLSFFNGRLPADDYSALRMSLFLRVQKKLGKDVNGYKSDIRDRFGDRGASISNLCSEGHFEDLKRWVEDNNIDSEGFRRYYEIMVEKRATAMFVNSHMTSATMESLFTEMVAKAKKYHVRQFSIHGLGASNVNLIKGFTSGLEETDDYTVNCIYMERDGSATEYVVTMNIEED